MPLRTTTIDRTTILPHPPTLVFAVVNSPDTAPQIDPAVRIWRADTRPIGVGTRFTIRGRQGIVPIRATSEAITWDPPTLSEYRSVSLTWPFRMIARHRFLERPDGGTDYTWSIDFVEVSVIARPLIPIAAKLFSRAFAAQAEALTSYLADYPTGQPPPTM